MRTSRTRRSMAAGVGLVALLTLTACGDDDTSTTDTTAAPTTVASDSTSTTAAEMSDTTDSVGSADVLATATLGTAETEYGEVLTSPDGLTLYEFDADAGGEPTCVDAACADKWPPLLAEAAELPDGIEGVELGTVERPDGTPQVTINGRPAYTMAIDRPGEANCQGGDDVWWIIGLDGEPNRDI